MTQQVMESKDIFKSKNHLDLRIFIFYIILLISTLLISISMLKQLNLYIDPVVATLLAENLLSNILVFVSLIIGAILIVSQSLSSSGFQLNYTRPLWKWKVIQIAFYATVSLILSFFIGYLEVVTNNQQGEIFISFSMIIIVISLVFFILGCVRFVIFQWDLQFPEKLLISIFNKMFTDLDGSLNKALENYQNNIPDIFDFLKKQNKPRVTKIALENFVQLTNNIFIHDEFKQALKEHERQEENRLLRELDQYEIISRKLDLLFREYIFNHLDITFKEKRWEDVILIFSTIQKLCKSFINLNDESIFSNWYGSLDEFYWELIKPLYDGLQNLKTRVYNQSLYCVLINFSITLISPLVSAASLLDQEFKNEFTIDYSLDELSRIIKYEIERPRLFYTSEDYFANPLPFSILLEPIVSELSNVLNNIQEPKIITRQHLYIGNRFWNVLQPFFERIDMSLVGYRLSNSFFKKLFIVLSDDFIESIPRLLNVEDTRITRSEHFDYIFDPITSELNSLELINQSLEFQIQKFSEVTLKMFTLYRNYYTRVAISLKKCLISCIKLLENKEGFHDITFRFLDELFKEGKLNDDRHVIYGALLLSEVYEKYSHDPKYISIG